MANEATLHIETHTPINFTVADGTGIEKGALLALSDPFTAATHSAAEQNFAGVAAREKIASNGQTKLAVFRGGVFKMTLSGSATVGDPLCLDASINHVKSARGIAAASLSGSKILGVALETGTTGETIFVEVRPVPTAV